MNRLMTHLVTGFPDLATTKRILKHMIDSEVEAIELQIPFSDPIADGPVLMAVNDKAVEKGVSVEDTLLLLQNVDFKQTKPLIMTYLQPIINYGAKAFFKKATEAGCAGYIIPDMPFDSPEMQDYITEFPELKNLLMPVFSPGMDVSRLINCLKTLEPNYVYITARQGITGEHTEGFSDELHEIISAVRKLSNARIAVGFGIQSSDDVRRVLDIADVAVIGSVVTSALTESEHKAVKLLDKLVTAAGK